jgi:hypothetical protein
MEDWKSGRLEEWGEEVIRLGEGEGGVAMKIAVASDEKTYLQDRLSLQTK